METKAKCGAEVRRRKPVSRNSETQEWASWNSPLRLKRQSRARVAPYTRKSCEMHETMNRRSRCGTAVGLARPDSPASQIKPNQAKSSQIKPNQAKSSQI